MFIERKRIWKKVEDSKKIFERFIEITGKSAEEWESIGYEEFFRNNHIPYPESDKRDNTEGVSPKQMIALMKEFSLDEIFSLFKTMGGNKYKVYPYYEDGFISWKKVLKDKIIPLLGRDDTELEILKFKISLSPELPANFNNYRYKEEVYKGIDSGDLSWEEVRELLAKGPYSKGDELSLAQVRMEGFWDERRALWKDAQGFVPRVKEILSIDPKKFDQKRFRETAQYIFGNSNIQALKAEERGQISLAYKLFGRNISDVSHFLKERKILSNSKLSDSFELYDKFDESIAFRKIMNEFKRGIEVEMEVSDFVDILTSLVLFNNAEEEFLSKQRIRLKDLRDLIDAAQIARDIYSSRGEKGLESMDYRIMSIFSKYSIPNNKRVEIMELFKSSCHLETDIPLHKGFVDGYEWEMIPKSDIRGLIAGDATHCCQNLGGAAHSCVVYGATQRNSSFFIISKDGYIVGQSWVWTDGDQLTFDNIETLGDVRESIVKCYKEYAELVSDEYKVTVGAGHSDVKLEEFFERAKDFKTIRGVYSDANSQFLITKKR